MYGLLRLLLPICGVAIVGLPFLITQFVNNQQWIFALGFGILEVMAVYGSTIVSNIIAREDFTKWSNVVKRAYGNLEATHRLAGFSDQDGVRISLFVPDKRGRD